MGETGNDTFGVRGLGMTRTYCEETDGTVVDDPIDDTKLCIPEICGFRSNEGASWTNCMARGECMTRGV